jgi:ribosomal-protein-alanine acetyltransferase
MLIRPATPADIPHMHSLERDADTAAHWAKRAYDALFAPEAPKRLAFIVGEADGVAGFVIVRCDPDDWEIENVVVAAHWRRQGIGSNLVREVLHQALQDGATSVLLEVRENNQTARGLYEKLGFIEVGRRPNYYENPREDALLLKISLSIP